MVSGDGVTDTLVGVGNTTCTVAVPLALPVVAVIVTVPVSGFAVPGCTRPVADTVAIALLLDFHVVGRLSSVSPAASLTVSLNCSVELFGIVELAGTRMTVVAGTWLTVTDPPPTMPWADANTESLPGPTPVTRPV
jgi:hypothetical protein